MSRSIIWQNLTKHADLAVVIALALAGTLAACDNLTSWQFAIVGDEGPFFDFAKGLAEHNLRVNPFSLQGVYGTHRVLESYAQAIFLWRFGANWVVWKCASVFMLLPSVICFYLFARHLYGRSTALISVPLLAFSKYLSNFFKIGYTHSFCFFLLMLCLYAAARFWTTPTNQRAGVLGVCLGLAFFAYIGPVFPFFLLPIWLGLLMRERQRALPRLLIVAAIWLAFIGLGLVSTPSAAWLGGLQKTTAHREFDSNVQILINIGRNFLLFWTNFDYFYNHFVVGPYLDLISRWAAAGGMAFCLWRWRQREGLLLWLWGMLCLGLGLINPYWYTPTTRGIFLVPFGVLFAAVALNFFRQRCARWHGAALVGLALTAAVGLNLHEARTGVFRVTGYSRMALIVRELLTTNAVAEPLLLFTSPEANFPIHALRELLTIRDMDPARLIYSQNRQEACLTPAVRLLILADDPLFQAIAPTALCDFARLSAPRQIVPIQGHFP